jgi:hypothetical protein
MNRFCIFLLSSLLPVESFAQDSDPSGIYYLQGVMETASGFKLNNDSTFEFFFSQGALDRTGNGRWSRDRDSIVFHSQGKRTEGFVLLKSEKKPGSKIRILIREENKALAGFVYARLIQKTATEFIPVSAELMFEWDKAPFSEMELLFELCPDRTYRFSSANPEHNYFEFAFDRTICDVYFDELSLKFNGTSLSGQHPLLQGTNFTYYREADQE